MASRPRRDEKSFLWVLRCSVKSAIRRDKMATCTSGDQRQICASDIGLRSFSLACFARGIQFVDTPLSTSISLFLCLFLDVSITQAVRHSYNIQRENVSFSPLFSPAFGRPALNERWTCVAGTIAGRYSKPGPPRVAVTTDGYILSRANLWKRSYIDLAGQARWPAPTVSSCEETRASSLPGRRGCSFPK